MLEKDEGGEVRRLFGADIPGGPIDDVAYLLVRDGQGSPRLITVLIEVKNLRHWLYPDDSEIFQLLDKATRLQIAHPDELIVPVLVCRQRQFLTHTMALDLGFFAVPTIVQPMLPHGDVSLEHFDEVRTELGYNLIQTTGPLDRLTQFFGVELPKYALYNARRWQEVARVLNSIPNTVRVLRDPGSPWKIRDQHMDILRQAAATELGAEKGWVGRIRNADDTEEGAF